MLRPTVSEGVMILKKDIESGLVKKQTWKTMLEYWIYRKYVPDTMLYLPKHLQKGLEKEMRLYAIIVTKDNSDHVKDKGDKLFIRGYKFTNEDYAGKPSKDLDKYLKQTKRK